MNVRNNNVLLLSYLKDVNLLNINIQPELIEKQVILNELKTLKYEIFAFITRIIIL